MRALECYSAFQGAPICLVVSSRFASIRPSSWLITRGQMPELTTQPITHECPAQVAEIKSEWWPDSYRNGGRHQIGTPGRLPSESAPCAPCRARLCPRRCACCRRSRVAECETAPNRDPCPEHAYAIEHKREFRSSAGSRFARNVTPLHPTVTE